MDDINQNYSVNDKLRSFTDMALREAYRRKKELVDKTKIDIKRKLKDMEITLLEDAYRLIQIGTRQNRKDINEAISKALVDGKKKMFDKRKDIIEDVFIQVDQKLIKYKITTEYPIRMLEDLLECIVILGDSDYTLEICHEEEDMFKKIIREIGIPAKTISSDEELGGGFILYGNIKRMRIDCSFKTRTLEARQRFLEMCRIPIDDGDLLNDK